MNKVKILTLSVVVLLLLSLTTIALAMDNAQDEGPGTDLTTSATGGVESLSGSFVVFDPSIGGDTAFTPGASQTFCFRSESFSPDYEYVYNVWEKFPTDWTVTNVYVQGTPWCDNGTWGSFSWSFQTAPYEVNIIHARFQGSGGAHCIANYCFEVVSGTGAPNALESWFYDGDGYGNPPHWPCSSDGYAPAGFTCDEAIQPPAAIPPAFLDPIMLTPDLDECTGCPCEDQVHEFTVWNNTGYDTVVNLSYNITIGTGTCDGPASVAVPNGTTMPILVNFYPEGIPGDNVVCEVYAEDDLTPANYDYAYIDKDLIAGGWDPAGWQLEPITNATPNQWAGGAVGLNPAATGEVGYVVSGLTSGSSVLTADLQMYDPGTSTWTQLADVPNARFGTVAGWIGNWLYVAGGYDTAFVGTNDLQVYNPATNLWDNTNPANMPSSLGGGAGGVGTCASGTGECLFHVGGGPDGTFANTTLLTYQYDPGTAGWTQLDNKPAGASPDGHILGAGVGCMGYVFVGGDYRGFDGFFRLDATQPTGSQWTTLANIPATAGSMTPALVCVENLNSILLIGGDPDGSWNNYNTTVFQYHIDTDTWEGPLAATTNVGQLGSVGFYMFDTVWTAGGTIGSGAITPMPFESLGQFICNGCGGTGPVFDTSTKDATPIVDQGGTIHYTIVITNTGASSAMAATMVDMIPVGTTFVPGSETCSSGTCWFDTDTVYWEGVVDADLLACNVVGTPITEPQTATGPGVTGASPVAVIAPESTWPGPDGFGYAGSTITYNWVDISTSGTPIGGLSDDSFAGPFALGQTFNFYGAAWTDFYVGSNGYISFGSGWSDLSNQCPLPNSFTPDNVIPLMWDDLLPNYSTGGAYYQYFATCPIGTGACTIVEYLNWGHYGGGVSGTWEAVLFNNGNIVLQYLDSGDEMGSGSTSGIEGANFAGDHGLTYACDTAGSVVDGTAIEFSVAAGIFLLPETQGSQACSGAPMEYTVSVYSSTGYDTVVDLTYAVTAGTGTCNGPASVPVPTGATVPVTVNLTATGNPGDVTTCEIYAEDVADPTFNDYAWINQTITLGPSWVQVPSSAPTWAGFGYPRDGCTAMNASGDWVTYIFGDMSGTGPVGFWGYNLDTNAWYQPAPTGLPADRWAPDWAYDTDTNLCYVTGGANTPGGGTYNTAYMFDPVANAFTALGSFTSMRDFHNSWVGTIDGTKYLCLGGGVNSGSAMVQSTQCYDLAQAYPGVWNAENTQMAAFPTDPFGAADGIYHAVTGDQFWYVGGAINAGGTVTDEARYWDDADNTWHLAGYTGVPRYRMEGDFFNGVFYQMGGSSGGFTPTSDVVIGTWDGMSWNFSALPNLANIRMDNVVAVTPDTIWSVDGYGSTASAYVEYGLFCNASTNPVVIEFDVTADVCEVTIENMATIDDPDATGPFQVFAYTDVLCVDDPDIQITVDPPLDTIQLPDTQVTIPFEICNVGEGTLDWSIAEVPEALSIISSAAPSAPRVSQPVDLGFTASDGEASPTAEWNPDADVLLQLDDGSRDNDIGIGGTWEFLWVNRFTPDPTLFPFFLDEVSVYFSSVGLVNVGDNMILVLYENTSGNVDPAVGSNFLASFPVTVQTLDAWNTYVLPSQVDFNGPGDVIVGVIGLEIPGTSYWPASIDQTATQARSWAGWYLSSPPPTPPVLPPDDTWILIDVYFPGNWMVRAAGETIIGADVPWLSEDPISGSLGAGACEMVDVTFDSTGLSAGLYEASLDVSSNDPDEPVINLPVSMLVVEPAIELAKTVGTDPSVCATTDEITVDEGTTVYYCYTVTNTGDVMLDVHNLDDDILGPILIDFPYDLMPGASAFITVSAVIDADVTNIGTWTASAGAFSVEASDTATVNVIIEPDVYWYYLPINFKIYP